MVTLYNSVNTSFVVYFPILNPSLSMVQLPSIFPTITFFPLPFVWIIETFNYLYFTWIIEQAFGFSYYMQLATSMIFLSFFFCSSYTWSKGNCASFLL